MGRLPLSPSVVVLTLTIGLLLPAFASAARESSQEHQSYGSISGRVQTKDGTPLPGANVAALRLEFNGEQTRYSSVRLATTRADGSYVLRGLGPGSYYVVAVPPTQSHANPARALQPTYYPASLSAEEALPVSIVPGAEISGFELTVTEAPAYSVCGRVDGLPDESADSLFLSLVRLGPEAAAFVPRKTRVVRTTTDASSRFCFQSVASGDYSIQLNGSVLQGERNVAMTGRADVSISNHNVTGVQLLAGTAPRIMGTIRAEAQSVKEQNVYASMADPLPIYDGDTVVAVQPNPNVALLPSRGDSFHPERAATVEGIDGPIDMRVCLVAADAFQQGQQPFYAQVGNGGSFTLTDVPSGRYRVLTEDAPLGFFIKSVRYGGRDVTGQLQVISGSGEQLDILLSSDAVSSAE